MAKKLKYTLAGFATLIVLFGIVIVSVPQVIDTRLLKTQIIRALQDSTGRQLTINGEIEWTFLPSFTLEVDNATLANPDSFPEKTPFASITKLKLNVELLPLIFSKQLIMNELILETAAINLTTLPNGQNNWQDLLTRPATANAAASTQKPAAADEAKDKPVNFQLADFKIRNSNLIYNNQQRSERWEVTQFNVDSHDISFNQAFQLAIDGKISHPPSDQIIEININTEVNAHPSQEAYLLKSLKIKSNLIDKNTPNGQKIDLAIDEVQVDAANKAFIFDKLALDAFGSLVTGNLQANNAQQYPQILGDLKFDQLHIGKFDVSEINLHLKGQNGSYALKPVTAKLYGGALNADVTVNTSKGAPNWQVNYQLNNIQMQSLLQSVYGYERVSGTASGTGQLTAIGLDPNTIISSLMGKSNVQLNDGSLDGVDIAYWWQIGNKLLNKDPLLTGLKDTKKTQITHMSGSFNFDHGVATTNDLQMYNDIIFIQARGTINLVTQYVDLTLNVSQSSNGQPTGTPIPLIMQGNFGNVRVKPDEKTIAVMATKLMTSKIVQSAVDKIKEKTPEKLKQPITNLYDKLTGK